jgi:methyl-accepting chemotaxis protein
MTAHLKDHMGILNFMKTVSFSSVLENIKLSLLALKISLRSKMLILIAIVFIGFGFVFILGAHLVKDVKIGSDRYAKIRTYHKTLEKIALLNSDFNQIRVEYLTVVEESNQELQKQGLSTVYALNNRINQSFEEILQAIPKEHQKPFADARDEWQVFTDNMSGKIIPVILEGNKELALERLQSIQRYRYERVASGLKAVTETLNGLTNDLEHSTDMYIGNRITTIIVSSSLTAIIILVIALAITSLIVRPLRRAVTFTQNVSSGDLTRKLYEPVNDEVGALAVNLNAMVTGLGQLVGKIYTVSLELSGVSRTVSKTSDQVSTETQIQTSSIARSCSAIHEISKTTQNILNDVTNLSLSNQSTHSSVNEMAACMSDIVGYTELLTSLADDVGTSITSIDNSILTLDNSIDSLNVKTSETSSSVTLLEESVMEIQQKSLTTSQLAAQTNRYAASGQDAVNAAIASMDEIRNSSKIAYDVIADLSDSADDIGVILTVINDINARTSLLSLNAQILSAQAGGAGTAFGIVASEFKSLSKQTAHSTLEIARKIERVQSQTKRAVEAIGKTESVVAKGESLSRLSGYALGKIVAGVQQTSQEMDAIAAAIEKQRLGSSQIAEAVLDISTTMRHVAEASHELKQESRLIISNSEQMVSMSGSVSRSIKENESAARHISRASENITLMIEQIKTSCEAETVESSRILSAMEDISATFTSNLASAQAASHASNILIHQVDFLFSAVNQFKHNDSVVKRDQVPTESLIAIPYYSGESCPAL